MSVVDPLQAIHFNEAQLEEIFQQSETLGMDVMINHGGPPQIDRANRTIKNDRYWKGFFPTGHVLNAMSAALFTGFKKEFHQQGSQFTGITSDTDDHIKARNSLEMVTLAEGGENLEPGKYILLRYLDLPWTGFYDIFKVINENLLIGRVYLGDYPDGIRMFTFPMTRIYGFAEMTVDDHRALYESGSVPSKQDLQGVWQMDIISNASRAGSAAYLQFDLKPDGRLESRYQLLGLIEGLVIPGVAQDHFQLRDFTPFHDEIRKLDGDFMLGKYVTELPSDLSSIVASGSLGIFHAEPGSGDRKQFGFYYMLSRANRREMPTTALLKPFLDVRLPDGVGLTFEEQMAGWYFEGATTPTPDRAGDLTIAVRIPASGTPAGAIDCSFQVRITVKDLNQFIEGNEHEAEMSGEIRFANFEGKGPVKLPLDQGQSRFNYLRVNPETGEAEMRYHLEFRTDDGREFTFEGRKYMQKDEPNGLRGIQEVLGDYTTLYGHVFERKGETVVRKTGIAYMKFRTFEDLAAIGNLTGFLSSFEVTGTGDPAIQLQARMRFLAFTAQFVQREYDPLSPDIGSLREDVHTEVLRGADTPDYFSTRATTDLWAVLRDTSTLPLGKLINTGAVRVDFEQRRIYRDSFWKGSFAKDTLLGWEQRIRDAALGNDVQRMGAIFAGGSFWKRFDKVENGAATGYVVNYEIGFLPGDPIVRELPYPNDNRPYFKKSDPILLLNYRNDPYKLVYDTIKIVDENNGIGVMHLGNFPDGIVFATFVMARHNYPFEKMSVEDHNLVFSDPHTSVPTAAQLEGEWDGNLVFLTHPNTSLLNQVDPVAFRLSFRTKGARVEGRYRFGILSGPMKVELTKPFVRLGDFTSFHDEIRLIDNETLIGKWVSPELDPALLSALRNYLEPQANRLVFYYILKRAHAGATTA